MDAASLKAGFNELIIGQGFGFDASFSLFLGTVHARPIATSRLFPVGGVAGIYHVATLPEARGHGYGKATTLAATHAEIGFDYQIEELYAPHFAP